MVADRNESIMLDGMVHEELSGKIIGAAMSVLNALKPGLDEKLYESALVIELRKRGHKVEQQRPFPCITGDNSSEPLFQT